jgi:hypothetical protein
MARQRKHQWETPSISSVDKWIIRHQISGSTTKVQLMQQQVSLRMKRSWTVEATATNPSPASLNSTRTRSRPLHQNKTSLQRTMSVASTACKARQLQALIISIRKGLQSTVALVHTAARMGSRVSLKTSRAARSVFLNRLGPWRRCVRP